MKQHITIVLTSSVAIIKAKKIIQILSKNFKLSILATKNVWKHYPNITEFNLTKLGEDIITISDHTNLAKRTNLILVVPASANTISKFRWGLADNIISTFLIASRNKIIFVPAMNTFMYKALNERKIIEDLEKMGHMFIGPVDGKLFENETGMGRMEEPEKISQIVHKYMNPKKSSKQVLIAYGAGKAKLDAVRFITNYSTGTFGKLIYWQLKLRGCNVDKINISNYSNEDVLEKAKNYDIFISPASFSDFQTQKIDKKKIKKNEIDSLKLVKSLDVIETLKREKSHIKIFAFKLDSDIKFAIEKKTRLNLDAMFFNEINSFGDTKINGCLLFEKARKYFKNKTKNEMAVVISEMVEQWI